MNQQQQVGAAMMAQMRASMGPQVNPVADELQENGAKVMCGGILSLICCGQPPGLLLAFFGYKMKSELQSKHTLQKQHKNMKGIVLVAKIVAVFYVLSGARHVFDLIVDAFRLYETVGEMRLGVKDNLKWSSALNGMQYRVFPLVASDFGTAKTFCEDQGDRLAVLNSAAKMAHFNSYIEEQYKMGELGGGNCVGEFWFGLKSVATTDLRSTGNNPGWKWADGTMHTVTAFEAWHETDSFNWWDHLSTVGGLYTFPDGSVSNLTVTVEPSDLTYYANSYCGVYTSDTTIFKDAATCKSGYEDKKSITDAMGWRNRRCNLKRSAICERVYDASAEEVIYAGVQSQIKVGDKGECQSTGTCTKAGPKLTTGLLATAMEVFFWR